MSQAVSLGAGYLSEDVGWQATNDLRADQVIVLQAGKIIANLTGIGKTC